MKISYIISSISFLYSITTVHSYTKVAFLLTLSHSLSFNFNCATSSCQWEIKTIHIDWNDNVPELKASCYLKLVQLNLTLTCGCSCICYMGCMASDTATLFFNFNGATSSHPWEIKIIQIKWGDNVP